MVKLDMSYNRIIGATANAKATGKALSNMLAVNTVLQELNISSNAPYGNSDSGSFVTEFAVGLGANGALTDLNISNNALCGLSKDYFGRTVGTYDASGTVSCSCCERSD